MVYALDISNPAENPIAKFSAFSTILNVIVPLLTTVAAFVFLAMFFIGAFTIITAAGNPERIKQAQKTITFAVIGLVIIIASFLIVRLIATILNINNLPI